MQPLYINTASYSLPLSLGPVPKIVLKTERQVRREDHPHADEQKFTVEYGATRIEGETETHVEYGETRTGHEDIRSEVDYRIQFRNTPRSSQT